MRYLAGLLVGGQLNTPATTGYAQPEILSITGPGSSNADTSGNQLVYIHGLNFGPPTTGADGTGPSFLEQVTYGRQGTEYTANECVVLRELGNEKRKPPDSCQP